LRFWSLAGLIPYEEARKLQLRLVELRSEDRIPDTVLFLEHEPVVTRGRGLQRGKSDVDAQGNPLPRQIALSAPLPPGLAFAESERGGDLTYHGPGQLVVYPICKLDGLGFAPARDVAGFLRRFESVFIDLVGEWSGGALQGLAREGATGVWVRRPGESEEASRKIASMGIAVRRWVTYHGLAINCVNDLKPFHLISPCGFSPEVMTCLRDGLAPRSPAALALADWDRGGRETIIRSIAARLSDARPDESLLDDESLGSDILKLSLEEAWAKVSASAGPASRPLEPRGEPRGESAASAS
jgi:lipoyl(octanoyl) transferase